MKKYFCLILFSFLCLVSCRNKEISVDKTSERTEMKSISTTREESTKIEITSTKNVESTEAKTSSAISEVILSETSSEYKESNYIFSFADLPETTRLRIENKMYEVAKDYMNKQKNDYDSVVFEKTLSLGKLADRKYELIKLAKIYFLSLKEDGNPSFGAYNKVFFVYKTRIYDFMNEDGIDFYFPLYLDNIIIEEGGDLSYNLDNVKVDETIFTNNIEDYDSLIVRINSGDYNTIEIKERR